MTTFSSIKPKNKAVAPEVAEETPANAPVAEAPESAENGMSTDSLIDFMSNPREMPPVAEPETPPTPNGDAATETETEAQRQNESWFKRVFGGKTDGPAQMDAEMNDEMYAVSGQVGAELTDGILPELIKGMHDAESSADFKATPEQKTNLAHAWELYLRWIKQTLTPLTYLLFQIFIVYGVNLILGIFKWIGRIQVFGFHWPWSEKWKVKAARMYRERHTQPAQPAPAEQASSPPPAESASAAQMRVVPKEKETCMYWQWQTDNGRTPTVPKEFDKGKGFPRSSKDPDLIGKFGSQKAYMGYLNSTKARGRQ